MSENIGMDFELQGADQVTDGCKGVGLACDRVFLVVPENRSGARRHYPIARRRNSRADRTLRRELSD
jgi:hypothetical protein